MQGKVINFKTEIDNFKVKNGIVTINLNVDVHSIPLNVLSEISDGPLMAIFEAAQTELIQEDSNAK